MTIAKLLRGTPERVEEMEKKMAVLTGQEGILEKIEKENNALVEEKRKKLGVVESPNAQKVSAALLEKAKKTDAALYEFLGRPSFNRPDCCGGLLMAIGKVAGQKEGFFIKEEKLKNFLVLNPPKNIIQELGYKNVEELLAGEDVLEVFAALRFAEDPHWLNETFFRPYRDLSPEDFEKRPIKITVLHEKWLEIGRKFVAKKLHHISHLKEAGLVFVIPTETENKPGQSLEVLTLILHYFHEIDFYSRIFESYKESPDFAGKIIKALTGEVTGEPLVENGPVWRIVQRYLAKNDPNDPRLLEPHVNPEALHWVKAENDLLKLDEANPEFDFAFWRGLDWVGEFLPSGKMGEELVSYDLIDTIIGLTKGGIMKYLYHQQEALWNKIFTEYLGFEEMERLMVENLDKGYIKLSSKPEDPKR